MILSVSHLSLLYLSMYIDYFSELAEMKKVKKQREIEITSIGMIPTDFTPLGAAQATSAVLNKLAGNNLTINTCKEGVVDPCCGMRLKPCILMYFNLDLTAV